MGGEGGGVGKGGGGVDTPRLPLVIVQGCTELP